MVHLNPEHRALAERMAVLSSLTSGLTYEIAVVASDEALNRSVPLSTRYEHLDEEPPTWLSSSEIIVTSLSDTSVTVTWTAAVDNVGVVAYDIALNGEASSRVEMGTRHTFEGLSPPDTLHRVYPCIGCGGTGNPLMPRPLISKRLIRVVQPGLRQLRFPPLNQAMRLFYCPGPPPKMIRTKRTIGLKKTEWWSLR